MDERSRDFEPVARAIVPAGSTVEKIGSGGFARTFKIVPPDSQPFALKVIDPAKVERTRVEREVAALQRVSHKGVVRFQGTGIEEFDGVEYWWIRMDLIEGVTLASRMTVLPLPTQSEALAILAKLIPAAAAIWREDTAHRDLGPRNVLLSATNEPTIVDLGLARHVDDKTYTVLPTPRAPGWMSPEQVGENAQRGDWRSDQFVLGAIGYYLITGKPPFAAENLMDRWLSPATEHPEPILAIAPATHPAVAAVIERMMHKQPHRRFLKVEQLEAELASAVTAALAEPDPPDTRPGFYLVIGNVKNFATDAFLSDIMPAGIIVDAQEQARMTDLLAGAQRGGYRSAIDPATYFARSAEAARPVGYAKLPYGSEPMLSAPNAEGRRARCAAVLDMQMEFSPAIAISPYYYAGQDQLEWIGESVDCGLEYDVLMGTRYEDGQDTADVWTGVLVHESWLSDSSRRDELLARLTTHEDRTIYLLVRTAQASFAPLSSAGVSTGYADVFNTLREAGSRVIVGSRDVSGLVLVALGAHGWSTGVSAKLMNGPVHPEAPPGDSGRPKDRVYVPQLLNLITVDQYVVWSAGHAEAMTLETPEAAALLSRNPDLDSLSKEERVLLLQHNLRAQRAQLNAVAAASPGARSGIMAEWIATATGIYRSLPQSARASERPNYLESWTAALA